MARVDVNELMGRIDIEAMLDRVDMNEIIQKVDIDGLVERTEIGSLIVRSTSGVATEALDAVRIGAVGIDTTIARIVDRVLRRAPRSARGRACPRPTRRHEHADRRAAAREPRRPLCRRRVAHGRIRDRRRAQRRDLHGGRRRGPVPREAGVRVRLERQLAVVGLGSRALAVLLLLVLLGKGGQDTRRRVARDPGRAPRRRPPRLRTRVRPHRRVPVLVPVPRSRAVGCVVRPAAPHLAGPRRGERRRLLLGRARGPTAVPRRVGPPERALRVSGAAEAEVAGAAVGLVARCASRRGSAGNRRRGRDRSRRAARGACRGRARSGSRAGATR